MLETVKAFSDEVIITMPDSDRALNPTTLTTSQQKDTFIIKDIEDALNKALALNTDHSLIVVTGSLYLTHPAKVWLSDHLSL